jgi:hypothetical protein
MTASWRSFQADAQHLTINPRTLVPPLLKTNCKQISQLIELIRFTPQVSTLIVQYRPLNQQVLACRSSFSYIVLAWHT